MERCIVLGARSYDFTDKDTGRAVQGVNLTYLVDAAPDAEDRRGFEPLTIGTSQEVFDSLGACPGLYEMDVRQRPGPRGRPALYCTALRLLRPLDLASVLGSGG